MITINILTRTGNREKYFKTLEDSIKNQTYKNIRHIKSNDNPNCDYLIEKSDVINVIKDVTLGRGFYNTYLNTLGAKVTNGWVIILDDDSKLIDNTFIEKLADKCSKYSEFDILIYKSFLLEEGNKYVIPSDKNFKNKIIQRCGIDMACFCFHMNVFKTIQFDGRLMGDYHFLEKISQSYNYKFNFIDLPIGIWANYDGAKNGKN